MNRCLMSLFVAVSLSASVCSAQSISSPEPKATRPDTPVVTVIAPTPPTRDVIEKQSSEFVKTYAAAPNPNFDQIGRWHEPVCVMILGLPKADQAEKIKARTYSMAKSLGLPAAPAKCAPNVEIAFEDDPQGSMNGVARSDAVQYLLGYYHLSRTKQLKTVKYPIQAWYVTSTFTDGVNTAALMASGIPGGLISGAFPVASMAVKSTTNIDDPENIAPIGCFYRFTSCSKSAFFNVLIVADNKALQGDKLSTVADDMVMLALSEPKSLDGCYVLPSVIDRYAATPCANRAPPDALTSADKAYLAALYSSDPEGRKHVEVVDVSSRMAKTLIGAQAEGGNNGGGLPSAATKTQ